MPSDFGKALEGFVKMLGAPGEDGVFRYEPPKEEVPSRRPEDDDESVADWFDTSTDPRVAAAVREAEAVARRDVPPPGELSQARQPAIGSPPGHQVPTGPGTPAENQHHGS